MKKWNYQKGKTGEDIAVNFLIKKGYRIIKRNLQNRFGEIDLITAIPKVLVFVEVKLKIGNAFGSPEEMITPTKIKQIRRMAELYLQQNPQLKFPQQRIDAICIVLNEDQTIQRINHYENITM